MRRPTVGQSVKTGWCRVTGGIGYARLNLFGRKAVMSTPRRHRETYPPLDAQDWDRQVKRH